MFVDGWAELCGNEERQGRAKMKVVVIVVCTSQFLFSFSLRCSDMMIA
jgi:hypothetical protein